MRFLSPTKVSISPIVPRWSDWLRNGDCPAMYPVRVFVESGGLMSYTNDIVDQYRRLALPVADILKGKKGHRTFRILNRRLVAKSQDRRAALAARPR